MYRGTTSYIHTYVKLLIFCLDVKTAQCEVPDFLCEEVRRDSVFDSGRHRGGEEQDGLQFCGCHLDSRARCCEQMQRLMLWKPN